MPTKFMDTLYIWHYPVVSLISKINGAVLAILISRILKLICINCTRFHITLNMVCFIDSFSNVMYLTSVRENPRYVKLQLKITTSETFLMTNICNEKSLTWQ